MAKKKITRVEVYNPQMGWVVMCDNTIVEKGTITIDEGMGVTWEYTHPEQGKIKTVIDLYSFPAYTLV